MFLFTGKQWHFPSIIAVLHDVIHHFRTETKYYNTTVSHQEEKAGLSFPHFFCLIEQTWFAWKDETISQKNEGKLVDLPLEEFDTFLSYQVKEVASCYYCPASISEKSSLHSLDLFEKCQTDVTHESAPERMRAKLINDALDNHDDNDIDRIDIGIEN